MQGWRNDSTARGNHMFAIYQGLIVQMERETRRPARDHEPKRRRLAMAWCHRALHIRHYQATSNSQSKALDCGACRVATLLWTLHCVDSGNWCFKVSSRLKSSFILLGQGTCEAAPGEGKTNRKQLLPLFSFRVKAYQGQISVTLVIWVKLKIVWGNGKQGVFTF